MGHNNTKICKCTVKEVQSFLKYEKVMNEELKAEINIPFINSEHAKIVFNSLNVDKEPRKELITRKLNLINDNTVLQVNWNSKEARILRVSINSFLEHLHLVLSTIDQFAAL